MFIEKDFMMSFIVGAISGKEKDLSEHEVIQSAQAAEIVSANLEMHYDLFTAEFMPYALTNSTDVKGGDLCHSDLLRAGTDDVGWIRNADLCIRGSKFTTEFWVKQGSVLSDKF